jgi:hypothetical protein
VGELVRYMLEEFKGQGICGPDRTRGLEDELSWDLSKQSYWLWRGSKAEKKELKVSSYESVSFLFSLYYVGGQCNCQNT